MGNGSNTPPAIALMGPTGSGKTELAINLALEFGCEIISVDSAMVYRGMTIGTAKPALEERRGVPHYLIDILDPIEPFSVGQFRSLAIKQMVSITEKGKIPLLVGGTMLYFNALLRGIAELPAANQNIRAEIDEEVKKKGWHEMHRILAEIDPVSARRIHPNDPQRIQRALEVYRICGKTLTELQVKSRLADLPFTVHRMVIAPADRSALHGQIANRFNAMLDSGLIDEIRYLYKRGDLHERLPSVRSVGYRQVWAYLKGEYEWKTMVERAVIATRQLAKRQYTWLRKESPVWWEDAFDEKLMGRAKMYLNSAINID